jgi:hypothetical protein
VKKWQSKQARAQPSQHVDTEKWKVRGMRMLSKQDGNVGACSIMTALLNLWQKLKLAPNAFIDAISVYLPIIAIVTTYSHMISTITTK